MRGPSLVEEEEEEGRGSERTSRKSRRLLHYQPTKHKTFLPLTPMIKKSFGTMNEPLENGTSVAY